MTKANQLYFASVVCYLKLLRCKGFTFSEQDGWRIQCSVYGMSEHNDRACCTVCKTSVLDLDPPSERSEPLPSLVLQLCSEGWIYDNMVLHRITSKKELTSQIDPTCRTSISSALGAVLVGT